MDFVFLYSTEFKTIYYVIKKTKIKHKKYYDDDEGAADEKKIVT